MLQHQQRLSLLWWLPFLQLVLVPCLLAPTTQSSFSSSTGEVASTPVRWNVVSALPNGAASCVGGKAAVSGFHLDMSNNRAVVTGELAQGGVQLLIDNRLPLIPTAPTRLETGIDYALTVQTSNPNGFQGVLLRLEDTATSNKRDLSLVMLPSFNDLDLQTATVCQPPIGGITHTNSTSKMAVTANLRLAFPGTLHLDVTMVGANDATTSVYGYNQYEIIVEGAPDTLAPSLPPGKTLAPTASPAPTVAPTVADIQTTLSPTFDIQLVSSATTTTHPCGNYIKNLMLATMASIVGITIHWLT